ncbi:hypothetical protein J2T14_000329 [Paenibacillus harenae]|nr:hypothetical protein [Paenibacillus harenae]
MKFGYYGNLSRNHAAIGILYNRIGFWGKLMADKVKCDKMITN